MPATINLPTLYKYDPALFDDLVFPEGLDREILIGSILRVLDLRFQPGPAPDVAETL